MKLQWQSQFTIQSVDARETLFACHKFYYVFTWFRCICNDLLGTFF